MSGHAETIVPAQCQTAGAGVRPVLHHPDLHGVLPLRLQRPALLRQREVPAGDAGAALHDRSRLPVDRPDHRPHHQLYGGLYVKEAQPGIRRLHAPGHPPQGHRPAPLPGVRLHGAAGLPAGYAPGGIAVPAPGGRGAPHAGKPIPSAVPPLPARGPDHIGVLFPHAPVLALTATATPEVVEDIQEKLKFSVPHVLSKSFRRENISYVVRKANDKLGELLHILSKLQDSAIVYVKRRTTAEELTKFLTSQGICADFYHAGLSALQREGKQENWKAGTIPVIVATNAFGMGIDKPDVRIVVHFDIPDSPEAYFQEAGRAGRDGKRAYAVLLYNEATLTALKKRVTQSFPEKKYIREIYQHLGNFFRLEEGAGAGFAFEFDPDAFVKTFKLDYVRTSAAIEVLQIAGYLECTTDVHARSRISFLVVRDQLYKIELNDALAERLIEFILRNYSGIFVQYAYVDEGYVAEHLGVSRDLVYHALLNLAQRRIISYIPGNDRPYIVYHQPRVPASYLHIGRDAYEDRKKIYTRKIENMARYIESENICRQLYLMAYFGQKEKQPCGVCDYCLGKKKKVQVSDIKEIDDRILFFLRQSDREVKDLIHLIGQDREWVIDRIRYLLECEKIVYKSPTVLSVSN